jgi:hypothetical protein
LNEVERDKNRLKVAAYRQRRKMREQLAMPRLQEQAGQGAPEMILPLAEPITDAEDFEDDVEYGERGYEDDEYSELDYVEGELDDEQDYIDVVDDTCEGEDDDTYGDDENYVSSAVSLSPLASFGVALLGVAVIAMQWRIAMLHAQKSVNPSSTGEQAEIEGVVQQG